MKKIIRTTLTTLALSSVCGANFAQAEAVSPTLKMNGNSIFNIYIANQKVKNNGRKGVHFANDISDLVFLIAGRTATGIEYSYKMVFQAYSNAHPVVSQNYLQFNTTAGTFQFGNVVGVEDTMVQDAGSIVGGVGSFDGPFHKVFNISALTLRGNDNIGDTGYGTKIVYYTPDFAGFRFGISYTPDTTHLGEAAMNTNTTKKNCHVPGQRTFFPKTEKGVDVIGVNNVALGLGFHRLFGNFDVNLNGVYLFDKSYLAAKKNVHRLRVRNTSAYQLGMVLGYKLENSHLIQFGAGFLDNGRSRLMKRPLKSKAEDYGFAVKKVSGQPTEYGDGHLSKGNSGRSWNVGMAYSFGAYKFSTAFQETSRKTDAKNKVHNQIASVAADVTPVAGLKFYTEVDYIRSRSNPGALALAKLNNNSVNKDTPNRRNQGVVAIVGTKISF